MARGKQTPQDKRDEVIDAYMRYGNFAEVERETGIADSTAYDIWKQWINDPSFGEYRTTMLREIGLRALYELKRKMPEASYRDISTSLGVITNAEQLISGNATQRVEVTGVSTDKLAELAGYKRADD